MSSNAYTPSSAVELSKAGVALARPKESAATGPSICHATVAHRELKSRTFHMQLAPLAAGGVPVRYISPVGSPDSTPGLSFLPIAQRSGRIRQLAESFRVMRAALAQRADIFHFQDPELLPAALALKLLFGQRVIFDSYEDFAAMAGNSRAIPASLRPLAEQIVIALQKAAARCFDAVITADPLTMRRFGRKGHALRRVIYNFPNLDMFPATAEAEKTHDIVYRGGASERAGTWTLLDALRQIKQRGHSVKALLIAYFDDLTARERLVRRIDCLDLADSITVEGRVPHAEMARKLSQARIGVCPLTATEKFQRNIPVKVFEYWACGLPVVASDLPPIRPFFQSARAGLLHAPGNAQALADALETLLTNPALARKMAVRGRSAVENRYNNRSEVLKLHRLITTIAQSQA
jgi:glycosyltransferase involved in cell wall biosynthesis